MKDPNKPEKEPPRVGELKEFYDGLERYEAGGSCDWGYCDRRPKRKRWDGQYWLPVCNACSVKPV